MHTASMLRFPDIHRGVFFQLRVRLERPVCVKSKWILQKMSGGIAFLSLHNVISAWELLLENQWDSSSLNEFEPTRWETAWSSPLPKVNLCSHIHINCGKPCQDIGIWVKEQYRVILHWETKYCSVYSPKWNDWQLTILSGWSPGGGGGSSSGGEGADRPDVNPSAIFHPSFFPHTEL